MRLEQRSLLQEYVVNYTNAATIISEAFKDAGKSSTASSRA